MDDHPANPPQSKPIMYHLYFRTDGNAGVTTYTPDGGWQNSDLTTESSLVQSGITYNITLESHTEFIRVGRIFSSKFTGTYLLFPSHINKNVRSDGRADGWMDGWMD
jgi:hypothetical protein